MFRVNCIHTRKISEIGHKHRAFDDIGKSQLLVVEDGFDILEHAFGLRFDVAGNQIAGRGINRDLPGAKKQIANPHGLIVRTDRSGRFCGLDDDFLWHFL